MNNTEDTASGAVIVTVVLIWVAFVIGYVVNIIKIFSLETLDSGLAVLRIAGIFIPPLGGIVGWF